MKALKLPDGRLAVPVRVEGPGGIIGDTTTVIDADNSAEDFAAWVRFGVRRANFAEARQLLAAFPDQAARDATIRKFRVSSGMEHAALLNWLSGTCAKIESQSDKRLFVTVSNLTPSLRAGLQVLGGREVPETQYQLD